jgi:hypothetical protein
MKMFRATLLEPENEPKGNKVQAGAKELKREQLKQGCLTGRGGAKGRHTGPKHTHLNKKSGCNDVKVPMVN